MPDTVAVTHVTPPSPSERGGERSIYCISGLGADHQFFGKLSIPGYELVPLPWLPFDKDDNMRTYAAKMAARIHDDKAVIIGLSFGGMLAVEMGKMFPAWKIFLVSSAKTSAELGYDLGILRWISKKKIVPNYFITKPTFLTLHQLGVTTPEEKKMMGQIMRHSDPDFYRWCLDTLLHWNNYSYPTNVIHIHGTQDKVIRPANVRPDYWIEGGSHIMIFNRAAEVSKIISDCLSK